MTENRPGGWVAGIGWVALLHDLTGDTTFQAEWGDDKVNFWRSPADVYRENVPVIVTRWADGSTPEPPKRLPDVAVETRGDNDATL